MMPEGKEIVEVMKIKSINPFVGNLCEPMP